MNNSTKYLFIHKILYDVYFYGAITIPFFVSKGYGVSLALTLASIYMVTSMLMEVPTGIIGDKFGHKKSVLLGAFLTGCALAGLLIMDNLTWDGMWIVLFATGAALTSGSDIALIRFTSDDFEKDNRIFDYLKSVMLLLSFGAAGFVVKFLSIEAAIGLSSALAFLSLLPLLLVKVQDDEVKETRSNSIVRQVKDIPTAIRGVYGGAALIIIAGIVGAVTFSAKEIISSFNSVYDVDIGLIGLIAAAAMAGRITGTALEKRLDTNPKILLIILSALVGLTTIININRASGIVLVLLSTIVAQMLFYRLRYQLSSQAPRSHVASLVSSVSLVGKLASSGIIMLTSIFTSLGYFHLSFLAIGVIIAVMGLIFSSKLAID